VRFVEELEIGNRVFVNRRGDFELTVVERLTKTGIRVKGSDILFDNKTGTAKGDFGWGGKPYLAQASSARIAAFGHGLIKKRLIKQLAKEGLCGSLIDGASVQSLQAMLEAALEVKVRDAKCPRQLAFDF